MSHTTTIYSNNWVGKIAAVLTEIQDKYANVWIMKTEVWDIIGMDWLEIRY